MRVFYSSDDVVKFEPVADDDIELADQMTLFANHVLKNKMKVLISYIHGLKMRL